MEYMQPRVALVALVLVSRGLNASGNKKGLSTTRNGKQAECSSFSNTDSPKGTYFNMHNATQDGNPGLPEYISRAASARALRVSPIILDRIVQTQEIRTFQIPGYSRRWIDRAAVQKLVADAAGLPGRARATNG